MAADLSCCVPLWGLHRRRWIWLGWNKTTVSISHTNPPYQHPPHPPSLGARSGRDGKSSHPCAKKRHIRSEIMIVMYAQEVTLNVVFTGCHVMLRQYLWVRCDTQITLPLSLQDTHTHTRSLKLNVTLWHQVPSKPNTSSHHEQIMICGELRHTSCLMESNRMEESHSHLSVRDIRIYRETDWKKGNAERGEERQKGCEGEIHWDVSNVAWITKCFLL